MTDLDLLSIGCVISFVALAGAYVYLRERSNAYGVKEEESKPSATAETAEAKSRPV